MVSTDREPCVILVNPPFQAPSRARSSYLKTWPPLGLAYMGAVLGRSHPEVRVQIVDAVADRLDVETVVRRVAAEAPLLVGITVMAATCATALDIAHCLKATPNAPQITLGGPHATFTAHDLLAHPEIDFVVRGEGEETLAELVAHLQTERSAPQHIAGLAFRSNGRITQTPERSLTADLDTLPFPARHLLNMDSYRRADGKRIATLISSRGCPYRCAYCCESRFWRGQWRARSPENVVDELEQVLRVYSPDVVLFLDDAFTIDTERAQQVCELILSRDMQIKWGCQSRVDRVQVDLLRKMRQAGCTTIGFGIESGSQAILEGVGRRTTLEQTRASVVLAREAGLRVLGYFMLGLPQETEATMDATIELAMELGLDEAWFSIATPYPGTDLYERADEYGITLFSKDWINYDFTQTTCQVGDLAPDLVQCKLIEAYRRFYQ